MMIISTKRLVKTIFLDLVKSFDCVDHGILLHKLSYYGVSRTEYRSFQSMLNKRKHFTMLNNVKSGLLDKVLCGVPQGSVLGPLLFLLHVNKLTDAKNCKSHLYPEDTVIIIAGKRAEKLKASSM